MRVSIKTPDGWTDYPFDYDPKIIAEIVQQRIEKQPEPEAPYTDGSSRLGVRVMCKESMNDVPDAMYNGIANPWPAILVFEPYMMTYDK
ncbi:MAG: hypothetical protein K2O18_13505 [Oscillospiraceae bacterium]|nr:hypothetical protein [Oscillospiraceae bacterium]